MRPQACNDKQLGCEAPFHELIDAEYRVVYRDADHLAEDELVSGEFHLHRFGQPLEFSHEPAIRVAWREKLKLNPRENRIVILPFANPTPTLQATKQQQT